MDRIYEEHPNYGFNFISRFTIEHRERSLDDFLCAILWCYTENIVFYLNLKIDEAFRYLYLMYSSFYDKVLLFHSTNCAAKVDGLSVVVAEKIIYISFDMWLIQVNPKYILIFSNFIKTVFIARPMNCNNWMFYILINDYAKPMSISILSGMSFLQNIHLH